MNGVHAPGLLTTHLPLIPIIFGYAVEVFISFVYEEGWVERGTGSTDKPWATVADIGVVVDIAVAAAYYANTDGNCYNLQQSD